MTTVCFLKSGSRLCGYELSGHAGSGVCGQDIVCAAISSAVYLTANTLIEALGIQCEVAVDDGSMKLLVKKKQPEQKLDEGDALIRGLLLHMKQLKDQYPENIRIITVNTGKEHYYA